VLPITKIIGSKDKMVKSPHLIEPDVDSWIMQKEMNQGGAQSFKEVSLKSKVIGQTKLISLDPPITKNQKLWGPKNGQRNGSPQNQEGKTAINFNPYEEDTSPPPSITLDL
jgi:hypothetical protein